MEYTKEITVPMASHKVKFKTILSGAERETVIGASMDYVNTSDGKNFEVKDMKKMALAEKHQLLKVSVISIDDDPTDCFERLQKMYEPDYAYVYEQIIAEQKKMMPSTSPAS
jgi:hypothetical protein